MTAQTWPNRERQWTLSQSWQIWLKRQGRLLWWLSKTMDKATNSFVVQIPIRNAVFRLLLSTARLSCVQIMGELSGIWLEKKTKKTNQLICFRTPEIFCSPASRSMSFASQCEDSQRFSPNFCFCHKLCMRIEWNTKWIIGFTFFLFRFLREKNIYNIWDFLRPLVWAFYRGNTTSWIFEMYFVQSDWKVTW